MDELIDNPFIVVLLSGVTTFPLALLELLQEDKMKTAKNINILILNPIIYPL